jgi:hypothetical protein
MTTPDGGRKFDHTIKVDNDQLALLALGMDALMAGAGDTVSQVAMADVYAEIKKDGTEAQFVADCRTLYNVLTTALHGDN